MRWEKKGRIGLEKYIGSNTFARTFATLPTPLLISGEVIRIYTGFCDDKNVGRIGYVDVSAADPGRVLDVSSVPVLDIGSQGCFDDNGVVPLCVLRAGNEIRLYYVGFQLGVKVPYFMFGGLASSSDGGNTFCRVFRTPVLDRKDDELFARCGMFVMKDGDRYKMWYVGTLGGGGGFKAEGVSSLFTRCAIRNPQMRYAGTARRLPACSSRTRTSTDLAVRLYGKKTAGIGCFIPSGHIPADIRSDMQSPRMGQNG